MDHEETTTLSLSLPGHLPRRAGALLRNIYIPKELTMPLQVKAAYNGRDILFRYRWPAKQPSIYHDMLKFEGGKWVRFGASVAGPQPQGIYEDRVTMLVDDGSVPSSGATAATSLWATECASSPTRPSPMR
jgi:hypothetical protein